jgi:hypothetical protein
MTPELDVTLAVTQVLDTLGVTSRALLRKRATRDVDLLVALRPRIVRPVRWRLQMAVQCGKLPCPPPDRSAQKTKSTIVVDRAIRWQTVIGDVPPLRALRAKAIRRDSIRRQNHAPR